jgi:hypothetical protein
MRAGEIAAFKWEDVDVDRGIFTAHHPPIAGTRAAGEGR